MTTTSNESEVARTLAAIAAEYEASQRGLNGLSAVARHANIIAQQQRIGERFNDLTALLGGDPQEALKLFAASTLKYVEVPGSEGGHTQH
jgi:hypothetical protein